MLRSRKLARNVFHGMVRYQAGLEKKQAFLFRAVDIAMELLVMTAVVVRTHRLVKAGAPEATQALALADLHCHNARRIVADRFKGLWDNEDVAKYKLGVDVLDGTHQWLEADAPITAYWPEKDEKKDVAAAK